ncbi:uncharacterized protein V1510DRAFT_192571 [Dipodascopsis tothii]|uniref:uncharacterized protein n=1 Tax=Dipodascopsis tothii TaxID=44089 RepID=UPI0034CF7ADC
MIPFEALLPYGVILTFVAVAGTSNSLLQTWRNGGMTDLRNPDTFQKRLVARDMALNKK